MVENLQIYKDASEVINFWKNESASFDLNDFFCYNKPNDHLMVRKIELNKTKLTFNYN